MTVREPAVAGRFYPGTSREVRDEVAALYAGAPAADAPALAVMCPHAGWVYSGGIAARTLAQIRVPERVIVMCPNHTGRGARIAIAARGAWRLPGGDVPIDEALAARVVAETAAIRGARADDAAHAGEHAIEVLVPLLRARQPALRLVPIVVGHLDVGDCTALGEALARAIADASPGSAGTRSAASAARSSIDDVLVVASSDMSHYLPDDECRRRDRLALDALVTGDPQALLNTIDREAITMCGARPAAAMLAYARARGAGPPRVVGYATSGDAFGDYARVVGYAGAVVPVDPTGG